MPNFEQLFESASTILQSLTDNKKDPLHVGEAMACWTCLAFVNNIITYEEIGLNTTTDPGVKELYQDGFKIANSHKKQLTKLMQEEGVTLPASPESKPNSDPSTVPVGTKFTDNELANTININFVVAANMCAAAASQCLRTDVGLMFIKFQAEKLSLGYKAKELMQQKGWLIVPPYYQPPGTPHPKK
ncbi:Protein of unknown function [Lentibacillus halodurans]|uniref:DUF3231 family protein n=1 Tax=Lentibacillus halodurans TaxID=237679 RepID=A0A1I0Z8D2_9BACI|nr:DUF3231 family protein [Lentibacillus halodurans]SFB21791.1 Protein of unknown function [Lentibacillus halodurans]